MFRLAMHVAIAYGIALWVLRRIAYELWQAVKAEATKGES
jgi:hypothetical protein